MLYDIFSLCRILKQALRGSGSNLTITHMTTMSMCGLFLLEMAKKADQEFQTPYRSSHHTVRDAQKDIANMTCFLIEEKVAHSQEGRRCEFVNPLTLGAKKIASGYIENNLHKGFDESSTEENIVVNIDDEELYEL